MYGHMHQSYTIYRSHMVLSFYTYILWTSEISTSNYSSKIVILRMSKFASNPGPGVEISHISLTVPDIYMRMIVSGYVFIWQLFIIMVSQKFPTSQKFRNAKSKYILKYLQILNFFHARKKMETLIFHYALK